MAAEQQLRHYPGGDNTGGDERDARSNMLLSATKPKGDTVILTLFQITLLLLLLLLFMTGE